MQNSLHIIWLPLFLGLLFNVVSIFDSYSELWDSVHSVMACDITHKRGKRMLEQNDAEGLNRDAEIETRNNSENFYAMRGQTDSGDFGTEGMHQRRSRRPRRVTEPAITEEKYTSKQLNRRSRGRRHVAEPAVTEKNDSSEHLIRRVEPAEKNNTLLLNQTFVNSEHSHVSHTGHCSFSFGQASYQKSRAGLIMRYEDLGDNIHECNYCNANFWSREALKQSSSNAPLIYTNCCQKGQIQVQSSEEAPYFLEQLLDPNNDSNSRVFRENIRVYNSMFSFTSMGAAIDKNINIGSGPYVFKISGQVHHLMGSVLPSDGECPKFAQLYIYDTKNEISNRINAIDPTHVNTKIKPDIVQGLIKMFDENNDLVKEFRTMRNKFEAHSLSSFNMIILDHQPTDSKQYEQPTSEEIGGLIVGDIGQFDSNRDIIIQSNSGNLQRISKRIW
ncbi:uncharacterized protein LOC133744280 [Rosa rugosa]|uniref:uncharacterized protein LOC133744280 n=1 Tax=Rosa rugosa TaxID=74645 RepID=UPI002B406A93|nr:uncharacterized protein LOC133744280 [Rosa rugosa]